MYQPDIGIKTYKIGDGIFLDSQSVNQPQCLKYSQTQRAGHYTNLSESRTWRQTEDFYVHFK